MIIGSYLQVFKDDGKADFVLSRFRTHFPTEPIFLVSDKGDNFTSLAAKHGCKYLYSDFNTGIDPQGWNKEQTIVWLNRIRNGISYCNSEYLIYLEDDVLVRHNNLILMDYPVTGVCVNHINPFFIQYLETLTGNIFNTNLYGTIGGSIYKCSYFIQEFDKIIGLIQNHWDIINCSANIGYQDQLIPSFFMALGYQYVVNPNLVESRFCPGWRNSSYALVHGKDIYG